MMGSPKTDRESYDRERPEHDVTVPPYYLGRYPVTNEEYGRFLKARPDVREPEYWADRRYNQARQPVVGVSWEDASLFAAWAGCRLPTEAEWEYACRAGTMQSRYGELDAIAWYGDKRQQGTQPVGLKQPNVWGLHDMLGNVWEWCSDWYGVYSTNPAHDPSGPMLGSQRVVRGGSWNNDARYLRAATRIGNTPDYRNLNLGFRLARSR
jgi:formylglycine-generating enzyme required for sulfatase activity